MAKDKREEVKGKIDKVLASKPEPDETPKPEKEEKDKPTVWTPFAKKIYTDIKLYKEKLGDGQPTRAVATKFRNDIEEKLEKGKEKDSVIKYYNKQFKLPGVSTLAWNYFAESVIDPQANEKGEQSLKDEFIKIMKKNSIDGLGDELRGSNFHKTATEILTFIKNSDKTESILEKVK